ncbi:discoidin domain-containing protein [Cytophagaceae bacterium ABcell3]|nr:discoidin domain-containing protein [Cytophagaceae bacterium ABcell3]
MKRNNLRLLVVIICVSISGMFSQCKKKEKELPSSSGEKTASQKAAPPTCTHTISRDQTVVDGGDFEPGSVICLEGGTRRALLLRNFKGTASNPITFINEGKVVIKLSAASSYGINFANCAYVKLTGTGAPEHDRGIEIDGPHLGITAGNLSTNVELEFLEIHNIGFAGIMAKTDPSCDPATWRENYTMKDLRIHDCHIYDTKGEGIYVGNSFYANGRSLGCGSVLPHDIHGVRIYNNKVWNSGWEGIQVGCATQDCEIFNNTVENYGMTNTRAQNNGVQIGEGTTGKFYNNFIRKGTGNGLIVLAQGDNYIFNNVIVDAGELGIFCDARGTTPGSDFAFINNTIINPAIAGIWQYSNVTNNKFYNNIVAGTNSFTLYRNGASSDERNNLFVQDVSEVQFQNARSHDYRLKAGSPAIDQGMDVSSYGINFDFTNNGRPYGNGFDIGAFEYTSGGSSSPSPAPTPPGSGGTEVDGITVTASSHQDPNRPANTLDGNLSTRWSANGDGQWIKYNLGEIRNVSAVDISFFNGDQRKSMFDIEVSVDGQNWIKVYSGSSSGTTTQPETFEFADAQAKYVRITGRGNTDSGWNSYTSVRIHDESSSTPDPSDPKDPKDPSDPTNPSDPEGPNARSFAPVSDAYIDANNRTINNNTLQVGPGRNTVYIKYDVKDINPGQIKKAKIQMKVTNTNAGGAINVSRGSHNNWDENSLRTSNRPLAVELLSTLNQRFTENGVYEFDVTDAIKGDGTYTFLLELERGVGARHTTFSSKEGVQAPKLIIE